jgi:hypothetical protein
MMAGFEVIVRPAVLPGIRPPPPRILAPEDDPTRGIAVLRGLGGKLVDLTQSEQASWTRSRPVEVKRKVDVERIYKMDDDGSTVHRGTFVDVERMTKLTTYDVNGNRTETRFAIPPERPNVEVLKENQERLNENYQGPTE